MKYERTIDVVVAAALVAALMLVAAGAAQAVRADASQAQPWRGMMGGRGGFGRDDARWGNQAQAQPQGPAQGGYTCPRVRWSYGRERRQQPRTTRDDEKLSI